MKPAAQLAAGLLGAALLAPLAPAAAQTNPALAHRAAARATTLSGAQRANMFLFGTAPAPMHAIPEQGTLLHNIAGPAIVTAVRGGMLTFRTSTGIMATLRMPASRIRSMRIMTGTQLRLTTLNRQFMQIQVVGGRQRIPRR
jgi:hypothetical protein